MQICVTSTFSPKHFPKVKSVNLRPLKSRKENFVVKHNSNEPYSFELSFLCTNCSFHSNGMYMRDTDKWLWTAHFETRLFLVPLKTQLMRATILFHNFIRQFSGDRKTKSAKTTHFINFLCDIRYSADNPVHAAIHGVKST